jgi:hypothetical protein
LAEYNALQEKLKVHIYFLNFSIFHFSFDNQTHFSVLQCIEANIKECKGKLGYGVLVLELKRSQTKLIAELSEVAKRLKNL